MSDDIIINVSKGKENYSQRNNEYYWKRNDRIVNFSGECNVTSIIMMLDYAGFSFPRGSFKQPEDNLADFIMSNKVIDKLYKKKYPAMYKDYAKGTKNCYVPIEIHEFLAYGTNLWLKEKDLVKFSACTLINSIFDSIRYANRAVVISGEIPYANSIKKINHIVTLVGAIYSKSKLEATMFERHALPESVIIDDPYGYFDDSGATYGDGRSGNDNVISYSTFTDWFKPCKSGNIKYAHILTHSGAAVV